MLWCWDVLQALVFCVLSSSLTRLIPGRNVLKVSVATRILLLSPVKFICSQSHCVPRSVLRHRVCFVCILKGWLISIWNKLFQYSNLFISFDSLGRIWIGLLNLSQLRGLQWFPGDETKALILICPNLTTATNA